MMLIYAPEDDYLTQGSKPMTSDPQPPSYNTPQPVGFTEVMNELSKGDIAKLSPRAAAKHVGPRGYAYQLTRHKLGECIYAPEPHPHQDMSPGLAGWAEFTSSVTEFAAGQPEVRVIWRCIVKPREQS